MASAQCPAAASEAAAPSPSSTPDGLRPIASDNQENTNRPTSPAKLAQNSRYDASAGEILSSSTSSVALHRLMPIEPDCVARLVRQDSTALRGYAKSSRHSVRFGSGMLAGSSMRLGSIS